MPVLGGGVAKEKAVRGRAKIDRRINAIFSMGMGGNGVFRRGRRYRLS